LQDKFDKFVRTWFSN